MNRIRIPAGTGKAFEVPAGNLVEIIAAEGPQVADTWAFALPGLDEFVSTEHTRSCLDRLSPRVGDAFYSNRRRPMIGVKRSEEHTTELQSLMRLTYADFCLKKKQYH